MKRQNVGIHARRLEDPLNALERAFAAEWEEENERGHVLAWLTTKEQGAWTRPGQLPTDRDREIAATVVQWLGSNVGRDFLCNVLTRPEAKAWRVEFERRRDEDHHS